MTILFIMLMANDLIEFWRSCALTAPPYAHPQDLPILRRSGRSLIENDALDFESYVSGPRFGDRMDNHFHLSLLPVPYLGNLKDADIVILLLNPGFDYTDYWAETKMPDLRKRLEDNLRQSFDGVEFPFAMLDPKFCWHGGFVWWEKKLHDVIATIAEERFKRNYLAALKDLSNRLACIELVPYHSSSFNDHKLINLLPSIGKAREYVQRVLLPDAKAGKRTVIVTRQVKNWGLSRGLDNVVIYEGGHTRGASLSPNSAGGRAILERYGIR